jgi:hypothetical protein
MSKFEAYRPIPISIPLLTTCPLHIILFDMIILIMMKKQVVELLIIQFLEGAFTSTPSKATSLGFSPQANYTDWATTSGQRIFVPTFVDRRMGVASSARRNPHGR